MSRYKVTVARTEHGWGSPVAFMLTMRPRPSRGSEWEFAATRRGAVRKAKKWIAKAERWDEIGPDVMEVTA